MEDLILIINEVHDVFHTVGVPPEIQLPRFVVVGPQSVGKSSVLEGVVNKEFLPRGAGIVTRTPLELRLINTKENDPRRMKDASVPRQGDWAIFGHKEEPFTDFKLVQEEIRKRTKDLAGDGLDVCDTPIVLTIYSPKVVDLSLVDLPGMTRNPVEGQRDDIKNRIRQMVLKYISEKNTLILAVTSATSDIANSEAIEIARRVDPNRERTLVVVTQLDIMNPGTDASALLSGKIIPLQLGIIGVKNRNQEEINAEKTLDACLDDEENFFAKYYNDIAKENGIRYLVKRLNEILLKHIKICLPMLDLTINEKIARTKKKLEKLQQPIEPNKKDVGVRIWHIFIHHFLPALDRIDAISSKDNEMLKIIRNISGTYNPFFLSDEAYKKLVRQAINLLKDPCLMCIDQVYDELTNLATECLVAIRDNTGDRYPNLCNSIDKITSKLIISRLQPTKTFVEELIEIQKAYINRDHRDLDDKELLNFLDNPACKEQDMDFRVFIQNISKIKYVEKGQPNAAFKHKSLTFESYGQEIITDRVQNASGARIFNNAQHASDDQIDDAIEVIDSTNIKQHKIFNAHQQASSKFSLFGGKRTQGEENKDTSSSLTPSSSSISTTMSETSQTNQRPLQTNIDQAQNQNHQTNRITSRLIKPQLPIQQSEFKMVLTAKQQYDCARTIVLIRFYYDIIRETFKDLIPKTIMRQLVNYVLNNIANEIDRELLYNNNNPSGSIEQLLQENEEVVNERNRETHMLKALEKASEIVNKIQFPRITGRTPSTEYGTKPTPGTSNRINTTDENGL